MRLVLFMHMLGFALWIGGGMAAMVVAVSARGEPGAVRAGAHRLLARVHTMVIGLGALLVVATGLLLIVNLATGGRGAALALPHMWIMQGAGLLGGLLILFAGLPSAVKLSRLAVADNAGSLPPAFERYRGRSALVNAVGGTLALVALFAAVVLG